MSELETGQSKPQSSSVAASSVRQRYGNDELAAYSPISMRVKKFRVVNPFEFD
jgi:hypothetical protein